MQVIRKGLLLGLAALGVAMFANSGQAQTVLFQENFNSGLGRFSGSGRVYTGSYGADRTGPSSKSRRAARSA